MNPLRSLSDKVQARWTHHKTKKARINATKTPKRELFAANGWGPKSAYENRAKTYRGPLFPSPDYTTIARNKARPACSDEAKQMCNEARKRWWAGDLPGAATYYHKAERRAKDNAELYFEEAQLLWSQARIEDAKVLIDKALALKPDFAAAQVSAIRLSQQLGQKLSNDAWETFAQTEDTSIDISTHNAVAELFPDVASQIKPS